jgi:hypothetical protein
MTSITTALPTPAHSVNGTHPGDSSHDVTMSDVDSPNKRKRESEDTGDQEQKKTHVEDPRRLGIQDLHLDVGPKYLLCRTRKATLYSLTARSTALLLSIRLMVSPFPSLFLQHNAGHGSWALAGVTAM